ncbi:MAG: methyltransferase domain-containing protein [Spirochaetia bacterium]|nr:methyltransferase domain-containing protein [Spirochaetia bacterium]
MSHQQQHDFVSLVKQQHFNFFTNKTVLEFGSHNINGSVRNFFQDCAYIGVDAGQGRDVDIVCIAHEYDMPEGTFDVVLSCEMFEHDPYWVKSFSNMLRLCKSQGLIFFSCATTGRAKHGTLYCDPHSSPNTVDLGWEHYQNLTEKDFRDNFNFDEVFDQYQFSVNRFCFDLYFWGIKK